MEYENPPDSSTEAGQRAHLLKLILAAACASGFLLSSKLWVSSRTYPLSPIADWWPQAHYPLDYLLFAALLALLILIAVCARPRKYIVALLVVVVYLGLADQTRWQPWAFQYVFMFAALALYSWKDSDAQGQRALLNTCRLLVATIYIWSGAQKLNFTFINILFPSLLGPYVKFVFGTADLIPHLLFLTVPLIEICTGIGLLIGKFRRASLLLAVASHVLILLLFIPVRRNSVVWPWNIAMAMFVIILFRRAQDSAREILLPKGIGFHAMVLLLFGLMPAFSFFKLWDSYLSASLYSGDVANAVVYISEPLRQRLPPGLQSQVEQSRVSERLFIRPGGWSMRELNVPCYPERRVFVNVAKQICQHAGDPSEASLKIFDKADRLNGERRTYVYNCSEL